MHSSMYIERKVYVIAVHRLIGKNINTHPVKYKFHLQYYSHVAISSSRQLHCMHKLQSQIALFISAKPVKYTM